MKEIYVKYIAEKLSVRPWQVENCALLFEEGNTIPFISRYRKERTGGLDDADVAEIKHWAGVFETMEKRKATILETISGLGSLTDELRAAIENTVSSGELEDLYLPYRPKRRTRASAAREAGLGPLADDMYALKAHDPEKEAARYIGDKVATVEEALQGARDIIAETMSENAGIREMLRKVYRGRRLVSKATRSAKSDPEALKYKGYFDYAEPLSKVAAHRLLAMLRARDEGFLNLSIDASAERSANDIYHKTVSGRHPSSKLAEQLRIAASDAYSRLLEPSLTTEVLAEFKEKADAESVRIFGENLRQLLLAPPLGQKAVLAVDPGFRNGCKTVCLDAKGNLVHDEIIYPHPPRSEKIKSISAVSRMVEQYHIEAIAVGNGTASRETVDFIRRIPLPEGCKIWLVSEDGASIYSASEVARDEFPDKDVTVRGAVSIGRRLMDPLAELVKIDPKSLGVGQYQHDVDQGLLKESLDNTVESCVNLVGVDLNTASSYLLSYVAGIGPSLAGAIVAFRTASGGFRSRKELLSVPRLGEKTFRQCAGFLRIRDAVNPLDNSAVHPEAYHIVEKMAESLGVTASELVGNPDLCSRLKAEDFASGDFGLPTINDILAELAKPGRDPRVQAEEFSFADDVREIGDLVPGMELPGVVVNITAFGAFVDIGVHEKGLIHVSQMKKEGMRGNVDPSRVVKLHQKVRVRVLNVDMDRMRIGLKLLDS